MLQTVAGIQTQELGSLVGFDVIVSTVGKASTTISFRSISCANLDPIQVTLECKIRSL